MKGRHLPLTLEHSRAIRFAGSLNEVLIVIGIIALLLALLVPSLDAARECARRVQCANNMRQWSFALRCYRDDYDDYLPAEGTYLGSGVPNKGVNKPDTWYNQLPPYLNAPAYAEVERSGKQIEDYPALHVWICPSKNLSPQYKSSLGQNQFHYGMNWVLDGVGDEPDGGKYTPGFYDGFYYGSYEKRGLPISARLFSKEPYTVFMFDIYSNSPCGYQKDVATKFHNDFANILYVDGRVGNCTTDDLVTNRDFVNGDMIWDNPRLYWGYRPLPDDGGDE